MLLQNFLQSCLCICSMSMMVIYFIYSGIYMYVKSNPNSSPHPNLPFGNHQLDLYVDVFLMVFVGGSLIL